MSIQYKGYNIGPSSPTGGSAGKGKARTRTMRVTKDMGAGSYLLKKQVRFSPLSEASRLKAIDKCKAFIDGLSF
jgi:hypothetical protein